MQRKETTTTTITENWLCNLIDFRQLLNRKGQHNRIDQLNTKKQLTTFQRFWSHIWFVDSFFLMMCQKEIFRSLVRCVALQFYRLHFESEFNIKKYHHFMNAVCLISLYLLQPVIIRKSQNIPILHWHKWLFNFYITYFCLFFFFLFLLHCSFFYLYDRSYKRWYWKLMLTVITMIKMCLHTIHNWS